MFLLNSCLSLFSAAYRSRHPFSRSYGVILPSSLTMLLPSALGFSPHPPVSVYGTGMRNAIAAFLGTWLMYFPPIFRSTSRFWIDERICQLISSVACTGFCAPGSTFRFLCPHISDYTQCWNINQLSIGYVSRPRLRSRLTQSRSALLWNP